MATYRLLQSRRHVFELRAGNEIVADISMHEQRANVTTKSARYALETIDGVRKRVVMVADRNHTLVRPSTLAQYAFDLEDTSLFWRSFPGRIYAWITADEKLAVRYAPVEDGSWLIDVFTDVPMSATIAGAFMILRSALEMMPQWQASPAVARRPR